MVTIKLKTNDDSEINKLNLVLETMGIENMFVTEQSNIDWVNDINQNPESSLHRLKPITLDKLKDIFSMWCEVGRLDIDVAFGRTSQEQIDLYSHFISEYKNDIEYIKNADDLISRYDILPEHKEIILNLNKKDKKPKKLPKEEQNKPKLESGLFLCKTFSPTPFWIVFGNVEEPTFLKEKIYVDELMNNIYRDKNNYAYLMFPLLPINDSSLELAYSWWDSAYNMGLRENPNFILPLLYGFDLNNYDKIVSDYMNWYNQDEIIDRFKRVFESTNNVFKYNEPNGFVWKDNKKMFKPTGNNPTFQVQAKCGILTCLIRSIENKKVAAETLTQCTNKKYFAGEF